MARTITSVQAFKLNLYLQKYMTDIEYESTFPRESGSALIVLKEDEGNVSKLAQSLQAWFLKLEFKQVVFTFRTDIPLKTKLKNKNTEDAVQYLKNAG